MVKRIKRAVRKVAAKVSARIRPNPLAAGYAAAIVSAAIMLILGILGNLGVYMGAVNQMIEWHLFFSLSFLGIAAGMVEAAVISFVFVWLLVWTYNKLS